MLETFRQQSRSIIIYVLFGIIIAVFVVNFGPQSQGCGSVQGASAARVGGILLTENDFRYGMFMSGALNTPAAEAKIRKVKEAVMDRLIERELLAEEAERMGFRVPDTEIHDLLVEGNVIALGRKQDLRGFLYKDDRFDYELLRKFCNFQVGLTVKGFREAQRRELLANKVRQLVRDAVRVSEEEVRSEHFGRQMRANLEYVRVSPRRRRDMVRVSAAEIDDFLAKSQEEVKQRYHGRKFAYTDLPKEARLRHLRLDLPEKPADASRARAKAEKLLAKIKGGGDFAAVVRAESPDEVAIAKGGDLGWRRRGGTGLGDEVEKLVFDAKENDLLGVIENKAGLHIVRIEAFRQGDQPLEEVERDIAEDLLRDQKAEKEGRATAGGFLKRLQSGADWEELFPPDESLKSQQEKDVEKKTGAALAERPHKQPEYVRRETGSFSRVDQRVPGVGISRDLLADAFELTDENPLGKKVYEVAGSMFLVKLKEREEPDAKEFEERKSEIIEIYAAQKSFGMLGELTKRLCSEANPQVNPGLVTYDDPSEVSYTPCASLGF